MKGLGFRVSGLGFRVQAHRSSQHLDRAGGSQVARPESARKEISGSPSGPQSPPNLEVHEYLYNPKP